MLTRRGAATWPGRPTSRQQVFACRVGPYTQVIGADERAATVLEQFFDPATTGHPAPNIQVDADPEHHATMLRVRERTDSGLGEARSWIHTHELIVDLCERIEQQVVARAGVPLLHAGAVDLDGHGIVVSGRSGAGKSTMITTLSGVDGAAYLSDELIVAASGGGIGGFARPIHLRRPLHRDLDRARFTVAGTDDRPLLVPSATTDTTCVALIMFPERSDRQCRPVLRRLGSASTARRLLANSFNLRLLGWSAVETVVSLAARAQGVEASYLESVDVVALAQRELHRDDPPADDLRPVRLVDRAGRAFAFTDSVLVVSGDRRRVVSFDGRPDSAAGWQQLRDRVDATLGGPTW